MNQIEVMPCMGGPFPAQWLDDFFKADFDAGTLVWKVRPLEYFSSAALCESWNRRYAGKAAAGSHKEGYLAVWVTVSGIRHGLLVHRVLWAMRHGKWPEVTIDHKNLDRTDNRIDNLREATFAQQNVNRPAMRSGIKGATFDKRTGRYVSQINHKGRNIFLGRYTSELEAGAVYARAAAALYGEFAHAEPKSPSCMGGACAVRDSCACYHAGNPGEIPAERLCRTRGNAWQPVRMAA
jgi:hypothetical protein